MISKIAMPIWTQADIDRLKHALGSGVLTVTYAGPPERSITYQSLDAMRRLLAEMVRDVSTTDAPYRLGATRSGLGGPRGSGGSSEGGFGGSW